MSFSQKSGPEKKLEKQIRSYLENRGLWVTKIPAGRLQAVKRGRLYHVVLADEGTPDLHFIFMGRPVYIEVKTPEGRKRWEREWETFKERKVVTKNNARAIVQHKTHKHIRDCGGIVLVVSSMQQLHRELEDLSTSPSFLFPNTPHGKKA